MTAEIQSIRFSRGRLWLDRGHPAADAARRFVESLAYMGGGGGEVIPSHNRMSETRRVHVEGAEGFFILKRGWCNPVFPWHRRLCRWIRMAFGDPGVGQMRLCEAVEAMGVETIRPVACWRHRVGLWRHEHFLLYGFLDAAGSLKRFCTQEGDICLFNADFPVETAKELGRLLRRLHDGGVRHMDPAPQNVLFFQPPPGCGVTAREMVLIDTDAFRWRRHGGFAGDIASLDRLLCVFRAEQLRIFCSGYAHNDAEGKRLLPAMVYVQMHRGLHAHGRRVIAHLLAASRGVA